VNLSERKYLVSGLFLLVGIIFIARLFSIQVLDKKWTVKAAHITERALTVYPARGVIYDRNHQLLVGNIAVYDLMVVPRELKDFDTLKLCSLIEMPKAELISSLQAAKRYSRYKPSTLVKQIPADDYVNIAENITQFPGLYGQSRSMRAYPDSIAAHAVGYISEVTKSNLEKDAFYRSGDYIGVNGLERVYEKNLRGKKGVNIMLVDVHNNTKGKFEGGKYDSTSVAGYELKSTLDIQLQKYGEALMKNKRGSIVAIEPSTGEILAMVNNPTYDPNLLVGRVRSKNYSHLLNDTLKPLFNRSLQAKYPPGSTVMCLKTCLIAIRLLSWAIISGAVM